MSYILSALSSGLFDCILVRVPVTQIDTSRRSDILVFNGRTQLRTKECIRNIYRDVLCWQTDDSAADAKDTTPTILLDEAWRLLTGWFTVIHYYNNHVKAFDDKSRLDEWCSSPSVQV